MTIETFKQKFGSIIYIGTLSEDSKYFRFKLSDRSMKVNGTMHYQPYVKVLKSCVLATSSPEQLFHDFCAFDKA